MENPPRTDAFGQVGDWMPSPTAIVKLTVDTNVTRRLTAGHIFQSTPLGCYNRLISLSLLYSHAPVNSKIHTTYIDEDGDIITVSSDWELIEAFQQFSDPPKPIKITCRVVERGVEVEEPRPREEASVPIQGLLESVLTVLARAVMVLQGQMSGQPKMVDTAKAEEVESDKAAEEVAETLVRESKSIITEKKRQALRKCAEEEVKEEVPSATPPPSEPKEEASAPPAAEEEQVEGFDPEFIHARHTCDGCLKAPVVGLRYHATNLPDYDLCEMCYSKYDGDEITFKIEECDRDKQKQALWKKRANRGFSLRRCPSAPAAMRAPTAPSLNETEALNEAIRRSLADAEQAKSTEDAFKEIVKEMEQPKEEAIVEKEPQVEETQVEEEPKIEESVVVEEPKVEEIQLEELQSTSTEGEKEIEEVDPKPPVEEEEPPKDDAEFETVEPMTQDDDTPTKQEIPTVETPTTPTIETPKEESKGLTIVPSLPSPPQPTMCTLPTEIGTDRPTPPEPSSEVVSAITNSMISEMSNQSTKDDTLATNPIPEEPEETVVIAPQVILSDDDSSASSESDDWDVVDDKIDSTETQVEADHMLAQAAQMIGSALFMSDMSRSAEELNTPDNITIPSVSSVPTITSDPYEPLKKKWKNEVEQLKGMGFEERKSVEILELLQAANVGVDNEEKVTVQQVVEYMYK